MLPTLFNPDPSAISLASNTLTALHGGMQAILDPDSYYFNPLPTTACSIFGAQQKCLPTLYTHD